jgi:hypothetical protein
MMPDQAEFGLGWADGHEDRCVQVTELYTAAKGIPDKFIEICKDCLEFVHCSVTVSSGEIYNSLPLPKRHCPKLHQKSPLLFSM